MAKAHKNIYLDYAAATPVDPTVFKAMLPYFGEKFYNPSALYLNAKAVKQDINNSRSEIAKILGIKNTEIIFTAGGTEANNLAIFGVMQQYPDANLIISGIEHESVLKPAQHFKHKIAKVNTDGVINVQDLGSKINKTTVLVSVMYANNEIGTIQPLKEIANLVAKERSNRKSSDNKLPIFLHTDAAQATNYLDLNPSKLGVDLMTINGGKIYGPKQSGLLYKNMNIGLLPLISGGGQEWGLRSGTENVANIVGLAAALNLVSSRKKTEVKRLSSLQQQFIEKIKDNFPESQINGSLKHRLPNNIHVTFPGVDNERLVMELDEHGIMCATGSACSASSDEPSHVLNAIGLSKEQAKSSIRISMGLNTTVQDIETTLKLLKDYC